MFKNETTKLLKNRYSKMLLLPKPWLDSLGWGLGDKVELEFDSEKRGIFIKGVEDGLDKHQ